MESRVQIGPRPTVAAIRVSVLIPIFEHIAQTTSKSDALLRRFEISRASLSDPYAIVPLSTYITLFETAAAELREANLGLRLGMQIRPADMGPMGVLFSLTSTVHGAFQRLSRYVTALQGGTQSTLFEVGPDYVWTYRVADPALWPRRQDAEYTLSAVCQLVRSCFGTGWRPVEIHFEHDQRADDSLLRRSLRAPVVYNQSANRIIFDRAEANIVHRTEDGGLSLILERHIADLVGEAHEPAELAELVRERVAAYIGQRPLTLAALASDLRISARSLQRKLAEEGTSLRDILKTHRMELARQALTQDKLHLAQIAASLGYADGTVFWRAFREWTGTDPRSYRRAQRPLRDRRGGTPPTDPPEAD